MQISDFGIDRKHATVDNAEPSQFQVVLLDADTLLDRGGREADDSEVAVPAIVEVSTVQKMCVRLVKNLNPGVSLVVRRADYQHQLGFLGQEWLELGIRFLVLPFKGQGGEPDYYPGLLVLLGDQVDQAQDGTSFARARKLANHQVLLL